MLQVPFSRWHVTRKATLSPDTSARIRVRRQDQPRPLAAPEEDQHLPGRSEAQLLGAEARGFQNRGAGGQTKNRRSRKILGPRDLLKGSSVLFWGCSNPWPFHGPLPPELSCSVKVEAPLPPWMGGVLGPWSCTPLNLDRHHWGWGGAGTTGDGIKKIPGHDLEGEC